MKRILSLVLCLAVTLSFSAPVSARVLNPRGYDTSSSQRGVPKRVIVKDSGTLTPTPARYVARVEEITLNLDEYLENTLQFISMSDEPLSGADKMRALNNFFTAYADAVAEIAAIKAPKEFAKTSALYKTAAKDAATWSRLIKKALKTNEQSDIDRVSASVSQLIDSLSAAENEYYEVCARLQISI